MYWGVDVHFVFLISALVGSEWSVSRSSRLKPGGRNPQCSLDMRLGDDVERTAITGTRTPPLCCPAPSQSLYELGYSGWIMLWCENLNTKGFSFSFLSHKICLATGWTTEGSESSLLHVFQIGSGVHPTSYPMGTWDSFPEGKTAGSWSRPLTSS
jgi:hypothetical protein